MPKNFSTRDVEARLRPHVMCSQLAKVQIAMNNGSIFARIAVTADGKTNTIIRQKSTHHSLVQKLHPE